MDKGKKKTRVVKERVLISFLVVITAVATHTSPRRREKAHDTAAVVHILCAKELSFPALLL